MGAAQLYDGQPRITGPPPSEEEQHKSISLDHQEQHANTKKYWEPASVVFPLYGTDYTKGVLGATVPLPSPQCNGDCTFTS